jgi:hypothetical protein
MRSHLQVITGLRYPTQPPTFVGDDTDAERGLRLRLNQRGRRTAARSGSVCIALEDAPRNVESTENTLPLS